MAQYASWTEVDSSNLSEIKYDERMGFLWVRFHGSSKEYVYVAVPFDLVHRMVKAKSVGKFFNQYIRDKFQTFKVIA